MDRKSEGDETKLRRKSQASTPTPSPFDITPQTVPQQPLMQPQMPAQAPPIPPEIRDELTANMQELLLKTHELSFEYSTLDCDEITNCPLALKSRELFKVVKNLNELMKRVTQQQSARTQTQMIA